MKNLGSLSYEELGIIVTFSVPKITETLVSKPHSLKSERIVFIRNTLRITEYISKIQKRTVIQLEAWFTKASGNNVSKQYCKLGIDSNTTRLLRGRYKIIEVTQEKSRQIMASNQTIKMTHRASLSPELG